MNYNTDHYTRNRQLKLLYVALSRAKNAINVYIDYAVDRPTFLAMALEGSVLKYRYTSAAKVQQEKVSPRKTSPMEQILVVNLECGGANKEDVGGLCAWNMDLTAFREGSIYTGPARPGNQVETAASCKGRWWTWTSTAAGQTSPVLGSE